MLLLFDQDLAQHVRRYLISPAEDFNLLPHVPKNDAFYRDRRGRNGLLSRKAGKETKREASKSA